MASIDMTGVTKSYGRTTTIHGIDLAIADGEFMVLLGPSGCGKSTLLRMIAGLETITGGEIAIGGRVVNKIEPRDRGCAMVFQNYALYPHMTVAQNIGYGLKVAGVAKAERQKRIETVATTLGIVDYLDRKPAALSGGQRQRVAMGRAMIREPQVFLFDEPLSNLDAKLRVQMRLEIRRLHQRLRATSVFVTHDQMEAMTLADRLVILNKGRVEQVGTPKDIYDQPASQFVADFIGSPPMNLFDGAYFGRPGTTAGFRPEDISLTAGNDRQSHPFVVEMTEDLGSHLLVHGRIGDVQTIISVPTTIRQSPGTTLAVGIDPSVLHFFDRDSGLRLVEP